MSCNYHVRQALLKAAAKKRFKNVLQARQMFKLYLGEPEEDIEDYCWCGELLEYCDHCGDCEEYSNPDRYPTYVFCPVCGVEF
jgi:hypothetical protein